MALKYINAHIMYTQTACKHDTHTHTHTNTHTHTHYIRTHTCVHDDVCMWASIHILICHACTCTLIYVMYVCVCVCVCVCARARRGRRNKNQELEDIKTAIDDAFKRAPTISSDWDLDDAR